MGKKYLGIVISHTHWDRAWYLPFQQFKIRLVQIVDKLIDILENNNEFKSFTFDGQTIVIQDYLEIRPENKDILKKLISEKRIFVGPWYILPDEFLVSAESLVRNLMLGHKIASDFGNVMKEGYLPDTFGHIFQMPQILNGFGIDSFVFSRGFSKDMENLGSEFNWIAPGGSKVLAIYQRNAYCNMGSWGFEFVWGDFRLMKPDKQLALERVKREIEKLSKYANTKYIYLSNGCDHLPPQPDIPDLIKYVNDNSPKFELQHGSISDFVKLVKESNPILKTYSGELLGNIHNLILLSVNSARMYLKQKNYYSQNLYEKYLEPITAFNNLEGGADYASHIWNGWKLILQNHPHDDISGCGGDEMHKDNENRFAQAIQIGEYILGEAFEEFTKKVNTHDKEGKPFVVYNPHNWVVNDLLKFEILFNPDDSLINNFHIVDANGNDVAFKIIDSKKVFKMEYLKECNYHGTIIEILCRDLPSCGYKTYYIVGSTKKIINKELKVSKNVIENEFFKVKVNSNGTLEILDKESGRVYKNCNLFEDTEDIGDGYTYSYCRYSKTITNEKQKARIIVIDNRPVSLSLKIELNLPVPEGIEKNRQRRSKKCTKIPIVSSISLISGVRRINVYSEVENKAKDHRLRVLFPSSVNVDKCIADGHFGVIQREAYFKEKPTFRNPFEYYSTRNQKTFVSVSDNQYGLTIANKGLPEYEILKNKKESVVALTLFRSIGWLSRKDIITRPTHAGPALPTPDAQCLGKNIFEYSIIPHTKNWFDSMAYQAAFQFNSPLIACRAKKEKGILKDSLSLISIQPKELIISSIKKSENGDNLTVRFYNIENYPVIGYIKIYRYFKNVFLVNLNEEIIQELAIKNSDNFEVSVEPYKICSLLFHF